MKSKYTVVFHPKAEMEYIDSIVWYEDALIGLGQEFVDEIERTVNKIQDNPLLFPSKKLQLREAVVKKFPYVIIYEIKEQKQQINILSVFHTKRNPKGKFRKK